MRICVCLHLYYLDMMMDIKRKLNNLEKYDLYITTPIDNQDNADEILNVFKDAKLIYTDNVGFDMYPFVVFLRSVDLSQYDLVFKVHTKKDIPIEYSLNGYDLSGGLWREYLLDSILESRLRTRNLIRAFKEDLSIGEIGSEELIIRDDDVDKDIDMNEVQKTMKDLGLEVKKKEFIAGSMFVVRASLLKPLQNRDYQVDDFPPYLPRTWNELPYCLERCMGMMISAQGMRLVGWKRNDTKRVKGFIRELFRKY